MYKLIAAWKNSFLLFKLINIFQSDVLVLFYLMFLEYAHNLSLNYLIEIFGFCNNSLHTRISRIILYIY